MQPLKEPVKEPEWVLIKDAPYITGFQPFCSNSSIPYKGALFFFAHKKGHRLPAMFSRRRWIAGHLMERKELI